MWFRPSVSVSVVISIHFCCFPPLYLIGINLIFILIFQYNWIWIDMFLFGFWWKLFIFYVNILFFFSLHCDECMVFSRVFYTRCAQRSVCFKFFITMFLAVGTMQTHFQVLMIVSNGPSSITIWKLLLSTLRWPCGKI